MNEQHLRAKYPGPFVVRAQNMNRLIELIETLGPPHVLEIVRVLHNYVEVHGEEVLTSEEIGKILRDGGEFHPQWKMDLTFLMEFRKLNRIGFVEQVGKETICNATKSR